MIITHIRPILLSHSYDGQPPLEWVGGRIETWDAALIEITTDEGVTGLGEVGQGIFAAEAVPGLLDAFAPHAIGLTIDDPLSVGPALRDATAFWARGGIASGVIGAIEVAALDAVGKARGVPAYELLGGRVHDSLEVYASGGLGTTEDEVVAWCLEMEAAGFATVKFRAMSNPDRTIGLIDRVSAALQPQTRIILDAVQGCARNPWSHEEAIRVGKHLEPLNPRWYEEPCRAEDVAGFTEVRAALNVPVSGVESYSTASEFERLLQADGVDIVQPDAGIMGGPGAFMQVAAQAQAQNVQCVPHIWSTGVNLAAHIHTAFATPGMDLIELCQLPNPMREQFLNEPLVVNGSHISAPTAPGIGVTVLSEHEEMYTYQPGRGHVIR